MNRRLIATATLAAVGCSLLLAGPAHAATAPGPVAPLVAPNTPAYPELGITLDSYDASTRDAVVTVTGTYEGQQFSVIHKAEIDGRLGTIGVDIIRVKDDTGTWSGTVHDMYKGEIVQVKEGLHPVAASVTISDGPTLPASKVSTAIKDGVVYGTFIHGRAGWTSIFDADGNKVAFTARSAHLADGSYETSFTIPDTGRSSLYTAEAASTTITSSVTFTINDGMTALDIPAPTVGSVDPAGTRALATVTGEPGATVTVKDAAGKTVAVKILGTSGSTQAIVPASTTRAANAYTATQTAGGATSAPTPFTA